MKKNLIIFFLIMLLYSCGVFQPHIDWKEGGPASDAYYEQIRIDYFKDKVIIPVTIQGKTRRFIFDSGAPTIISESLQKEMNYEFILQGPVYDINRNSDNASFVRVNNLFLGRVEFNGIPALVADLSELPWSCFQVDGFIGSNLVRNSVVQINKLNSELILTSDISRLSSLGKGSRMKLSRQGSPYIPFSISGVGEQYILLDTGSDDFVNLSLEYFETLISQHQGVNIERTGYGSGIIGLFGNGQEGKVYRVKLDSLRFDQTTILGPEAEVTNTSNRIGAKIFPYGTTTIDYKNKKFYFLSSDTSLSYKKEERAELGFRPVIRQDTFRVGLVWENSLVDSLGLKPGNEIVRINNYNFRDSLEASFCKTWLNDAFKDSEVLDIRYIDEEGDFKRIKMRRKRDSN